MLLQDFQPQLPYAPGVKPAMGTLFDPSNPLALGLELGWFLLEGAGSPRETVQRKGLHANVINPSGSNWSGSPYGPAFNFGSTTYVETNADAVGGNVYDAVWPPSKSSLFALVKVGGTATTRAILGSGNTFSPLEYRIDSTSHLHIVKPGTADLVSSTGALPSSWCSVGIAFDAGAGTGAFYINGAQDSTFSGHTATFSLGKPLLGAQDFFGFQDYWQGAMALVLAWQRVLPAWAFKSLHADPFQMLRRVNPLLWLVKAPVVAGTPRLRTLMGVGL